MAVEALITELGYSDSPNFLRADRTDDFAKTIDYGQILRRATKNCELKGVYALHQARREAHEAIVPLVYVCEAKNDDDAERIHRLVWNQNVAPFLIVSSQKAIRLYSGFRFGQSPNAAKSPEQGLLKAATTIKEAMSFLESFHSTKIDDGSVWNEWGKEITPETRVDWKLLTDLNDLDAWLQGHGLLSEVSHSLIGKYVYLYYLRHRDILSDRKLSKWGMEADSIFSRDAKLDAFWSVVEKLDIWLNGSAFVLERDKHKGLTEDHLKKVAGTFRGDEPKSGQLALDFGIYDFSFIPIETISVIYEQFLHAPNALGTSTGKQSGAFYTPIPLVNFMIEELDSLHPFQKGMKVLDPACGSGAFLVQCYRRIVEQDEEFIPGKAMRPARLRDLLESHIFGIDRDGDACRVAELSLSLTLLDYVDPPDLESTPTFQLPNLHGVNIFEGDFFEEKAEWRQVLGESKFDWIVGNPPWIELKNGRIADRDKPVWDWMQTPANRKTFPTGGNQVAEAFAWEVTRYLNETGYAGLLLPAMTLFKDETAEFRKTFFEKLRVRSVANFSNLAYILFPGHKRRIGGKTKTFRAERPAAGFFYSHKDESKEVERIWVFSPLVADQPATRPSGGRSRQRQTVWNIVVAANQVQAVDVSEAATGSLLPWKLAIWGSHLDSRLLAAVSQRFTKLGDFCTYHNLCTGKGLELRNATSLEPTEPVPDLEGQLEVETKALAKLSNIFQFPEHSLRRIPRDRCFVRKGRAEIPLLISRPPHIIVDKLRRFAVYSDKFLAVPAGQIGISGSTAQGELLKALSLYLVSEFAIYHQFLLSPEWGISTSISSLATLRELPVPFESLSDSQLNDWSSLHSEIVRASQNLSPVRSDGTRSLETLHIELNNRVYELLGLRADQRALVSDLVNVRMKLIKGKAPKEATRSPTKTELESYARQLRDELDAFVSDQPSLRHRVLVGRDANHGIVSVALNHKATRAIPIDIVDIESSPASFDEAQKTIRKRHSQWVYFERDVRLFEGATTYLMKPFERLHWTATRAQLDASTIISETLAG